MAPSLSWWMGDTQLSGCGILMDLRTVEAVLVTRPRMRLALEKLASLKSMGRVPTSTRLDNARWKLLLESHAAAGHIAFT